MRSADRLAWMLAAAVVLAGCDGGGHAPPGAAGTAAAIDEPWPMFPIDDRFRGANALGPGDVNRDGLTDYVTNYEFDQRYVIALHPPRDSDPREPWPTIVALEPPVFADGQQFDSESAALADLDGDGHLDIIATQGGHPTPFWEGYAPGVRVIWGPPAARAADPGAWLDGGRIPGTLGGGHYLWQLAHDVNGDGALDVWAGGRVLFDTGARAGIAWIEAPSDAGVRRDLSRWQVHSIDPLQLDGHGFVLVDVDEDADLDVLDANADFDTPEDEETIHWYENPGSGSPAQRGAWPKHVIHRGDELDAKPQLALGDLDGDGLLDFLTAGPDQIYWFRKVRRSPPAYERIVIPKPLETRQFQRPIRVADLDGDGRLDLFGMLVHEDGDLPSTKASAFWMEYEGTSPLDGRWVTHPIRWGSGRTMLIPAFGEKWDQVDLTDVDGDGDLDVVANCEEWWEARFDVVPFHALSVAPQAVAVVWFENRLDQPRRQFEERDGVVAIESEHASHTADGTWYLRTRFAGYGGEGYLQDHQRLDRPARGPAESRGVSYAARVDGGAYTLWARRWVPARWGAVLGGERSDSAWIAVDEAEFTPFDEAPARHDSWEWVRAAASLPLRRGSHTLHLRVRDGGYALDRLLLARDPGFEPSGLGPAETLVAP